MVLRGTFYGWLSPMAVDWDWGCLGGRFNPRERAGTANRCQARCMAADWAEGEQHSWLQGKLMASLRGGACRQRPQGARLDHAGRCSAKLNKTFYGLGEMSG